MDAMSALSEQNAVVTGVIEFADGDRPIGAFTVTVLVEDVSRADAPSTIMSGTSFHIPARSEIEMAEAGPAETELPFTVTVPARVITDIRRLNVRVHVREGAQTNPGVASVSVAGPNATGPNATSANVSRPNITEGDFVSTQSHPVVFDPVIYDPARQNAALVRIPVHRV
ncbi:hypothetical protein [Cryobacterium sp. PH29-G1]|uniref:hypothetical protein n=1 Tax=Cryobacterium sp. PH29-G1 TaxID=3046211 RepID=UPI0024B988E2|nr:hypothetical protein [Cryobacterium sp. PH29-G1]MDJ0348605.1 hypothetical protein [Cryobacterium sp. PH29-G1]